MGLFDKSKNNTEPHIGYWFTKQSAISALKTGRSLTAGLRIKNPNNKPPWMIVDKEIQSIIVTADSWPGSLWRARVIKLGDMSGLIANPGYWRATEIELIEELPAGTLFGDQGDRIISLLNQIMTLTSSEVDELYANRAENSCAEAAYAHAWKYWNDNQKHPRSHAYGDGMILASPHKCDKEMSPINHGFLLISALIWQKARELEGQEAFIEFIEYGETELELNPRWTAACTAFIHKAMGLSMSQYLSAAEIESLMQSWLSVFGREEKAT